MHRNAHASRPHGCTLQWLPVLALSGALHACAAADNADAAGRTWVAERIDTIATAANEEIGQAADLVVAGDGTLCIADPVNHHLVVFDPATGRFSTVGREGDGPGELRDPRVLAVTAKGVLVLELEAGRLDEFDRSGAFVGVRPTAGGIMLPASLSANSRVATPTLGRQQSLVALLDLVGGDRILLGTALAEPPQVMRMSGIREQALRREFPVEFRNNIVPVLDGDHVWTISQYSGDVVRMSAAGDSAISVRLPPELVSSAHDRYFDAVADQPNRIHVPQVAAAARIVRDELWIMTNDDAGSRIARLDRETGAPRGWIVLPGLTAGPFAVTDDRAVLYVAAPADALLLSIPLPTKF